MPSAIVVAEDLNIDNLGNNDVLELIKEFWEHSGATKYPYYGIKNISYTQAIDPAGKNDPIEYPSQITLEVCSDLEKKIDCRDIKINLDALITYAQAAKIGGYVSKNPRPNDYAQGSILFTALKSEQLRENVLLPYLEKEFQRIEGKKALTPNLPVTGPANNSITIPRVISPQEQKLIDGSVRVHASIWGAADSVISSGVLYGPCVAIGNGRYRCTVITAAHTIGGIFFKGVAIEPYEKGLPLQISRATVVARDTKNDIALLSFEVNRNMTPAPSSSDRLNQGMSGLTQVGCPQGNNVVSFLNGYGGCAIITCPPGTPYIECTPQAQRGRSGGPLFTKSGALAGITVTASDGHTRYVPINIVDQFAQKHGVWNVKATPSTNISQPTPRKKAVSEQDLINRLEAMEQKLEAMIKYLQEKNK